MAATKAADLALDPALLMRAAQPDQGELRLEHVVRAQSDEPVGLDPPATPEHLLHRRRQIVVANQRGNAPEELERVRVRLQKRLLGLPQERASERRPGVTQPQLEQVHLDLLPVDHRPRLAPVDLGLRAWLVMLGHERLTHIAQLPAPRPHIPRDLTLGHHRAVLLNEPLPQPPGGMTLLARRGAVSLQPRVDQRVIRAQPRRRPMLRRALDRRHRRRQRLPHSPAMHAVLDRQRPRRETLPITVPPDLLEQLHA